MTDVHADGWVATGTSVVKIAPKPAVFFKLFRIARGLPDFRGTEVGTVRVWVADALDDRQTAAVIQVLEPGQAGMKSGLIIELEDILGIDAELRAGLMIKIVRVRHHGIQTIVAAGHLQHAENGGIAAGGGLD